MELKIDLPQPKSFAQVIKDDLIMDSFKTGADLFRTAGKYMREASTNFYESYIRPNAKPIAAVAAVGSVGAVGFATLGAATMANIGLGLVGTGVGGLTTVGVVGFGAKMGAKVFGWLRNGVDYARESIAEVKADLLSFIDTGRKSYKTFFSVARHKSFEKFERKINKTDESVAGKTLETHQIIRNRYKDEPSICAVIDTIMSETKNIFKTAHTQYKQAIIEAEQEGISTTETGKQISEHLKKISGLLTTDIFSAYNAALNANQDGAAAVASQLAEITELARNFKITAPTNGKIQIKTDIEEAPLGDASALLNQLNEDVSSAATPEEIKSESSSPSPVVDSVQKKFSDTLALSLKAVLPTETKEKIITAATANNLDDVKSILRKECDGIKVKYNPDDDSLLSQAIKEVSIPAGRDIPHFSKLRKLLSEKYEGLVEVNHDGSFYINCGSKQIDVSLANPQGGKVLLKIGNHQPIGLWNDKALEVLEAFATSGKYPKLRAAKPATERIIKSLEAE